MADAKQAQGRSEEVESKAYIWEQVLTSKKGKKEDKNLSRPNITGSEDESPRRLRERPSWLPSSRTPTPPTGRWKPVTVRLSQDPSSSSSPTGTSQLSVFCADSNRLLHQVFLNLLSQTDIRHTHPSLFSRKSVLGIFCARGQAFGLPPLGPSPHLTPLVDSSGQQAAGQTLSSSNQLLEPSYLHPSTSEYAPLYISFTMTDLYNAWFALLRSHASPETYGGDTMTPVDREVTGGLCRVWRGIELEIVEGRGLLPSHRPISQDATEGSNLAAREGLALGSAMKENSLSSHDYEVSCEIYLDKTLSGRTTYKRISPGSPSPATWHERFQWEDLPQQGSLIINVYKVKPMKEKSGAGSSSAQQSGVGGRLKSSVSSSISGGVALMTAPVRKDKEPALVGQISISLAQFRRGELVEGWWAVIPQPAPVGGWGQVSPELKMRIKVDENVILPTKDYNALLSSLPTPTAIELLISEDNGVRGLTEPDGFTSRRSPHVTQLTSNLHYMALASSNLVSSLCDSVKHEIITMAALNQKSPTSPNTLFRGNSMLTKTMEFAMMRYGSGWLDKSLGSVMRRLLTENVMIETDINSLEKRRLGDNMEKEVEHNVKALLAWCSRTWTGISNARGDCPHELRLIFHTIRTEVDQRFTPPSSKPKRKVSRSRARGNFAQVSSDEDSESSDLEGEEAELEDEDETPSQTQHQTYQKDLRWQAISAFVFLRFFVPAILHPHLFGLSDGLPSPAVHKSLKAIAKVLLSLANLNTTVHREDHMLSLNKFLATKVDEMTDYLLSVSSPILHPSQSTLRSNSVSQDCIDANRCLEARMPSLSILHRESIPTLPFMIDTGRHLADIASLVVRNSRGSRKGGRTGSLSPGGSPDFRAAATSWDIFEAACFKVEAKALASIHPPTPSSSNPSSTRSRSGSKHRMASMSRSTGETSAHHLSRNASLQIMPGSILVRSPSTTDTSDALFNSPISSPGALTPDPARGRISVSPALSQQSHTMSSILVLYDRRPNSRNSSQSSLSNFLDDQVPMTMKPKIEKRGLGVSRPSTAPSPNESSTDSYRSRSVRHAASFSRTVSSPDASTVSPAPMPVSMQRSEYQASSLRGSTPIESDVSFSAFTTLTPRPEDGSISKGKRFHLKNLLGKKS